MTAENHLRCAQALWGIPARRSEAPGHARAAQALLRKLGVNTGELHASIEKWMAEHLR